MKPGQPKLENHFFLPSDQHLFDYDQIFAVSAMWIELGMADTIATYDLYVRGMPKNRNFLLFGGLEEIVLSILNWHFSREEISFLKKNKIVTPKAARLLRRFKYSGDIWAMPEGTIFFPDEPVVRLTAPIWQINLLTFFLINALTSNSIFFSKIARSILAADGKLSVVTCPVTRSHGNESSLKFGRVAYILGAPSAIVPAFAKKYGLPMSKVNTKAYHAFIKSFPTEIEAMRAATSIYSPIGLMVDTYDFKQGVKNAITVAKEIKDRGRKISALVLDSGRDVFDYANQARYVRKELNKAGFKDIKITATGNFDEIKIAKLIKTKAPVNSIIACTDLVTSSDDPKMEAVLKLAEYVKEYKTFYSVKLTAGKESYPGKKQVYRKYLNGIMQHDVIGFEKEKLGTPLLKPIVKNGKLVTSLPTLDEIKDYTFSQLKTLPQSLKSVEKETRYSVSISPKLMALFNELKQKHQLANLDNNR
jgi:nicotinate phosphoribosyltransferase